MNAATWSLDWPPGRADRDDPRASIRARSGRCTRSRDRTGVEVASSIAGDDGDDERTLAAFDAAITPGTRLVSLSHVLWTTGARPAGRADRRARPRPRRASSSSTAPRPPARSRSASRSSAPTSTRSRPRNGCSGRRGWARCGSSPRVTDRRARVRRSAAGSASSELDVDRRRVLVARRAPLRRRRLPPAVGRRHGPLDRLAVDVRRARLRPPRAAGAWPGRGRRGSRRSPASSVLTPRDRMATLVTFRIARLAGRRRRSTELGARVFAIARTIPPPRCAPDQRRLLHHGGRARAVRRRRSSCSPRTRPRRSRRAARLTILGQGDPGDAR